MTLLRVLPAFLLLGAAPLLAQNPHPIGIDEYITTSSVGDPQPSPDGAMVAYTVTTPSIEDDRSRTRIWVVAVASGETWALTDGEGSERAPRWAPDGKSIGFVSSREEGPQIWRVAPKAGTPTRIGKLADGVSDFLWAPDGSAIYFTTDVAWSDSTEAARRAGAYPTKAKIWTDLFYRHWNEWRLGVRSHLFRLGLDGAVTDLTPIDHDVPPLALGGRDIAVAPDGSELALVYNPDSNIAVSTNNEVYTIASSGGTPRLVSSSRGNDNTPLYSPDGKYLAWLSMATPGFEADRLQLVVQDRASGKRTTLTPTWTLSVGDIHWFPDSKALLAEVEERGGHNLYRIEVPGGRRTLLVRGGTNTSGQPLGANQLVFLRQDAGRAAEVFVSGANGGEPTQLTHVNDARFAALNVSKAESFGFIGGQGDSVFGWLVKPPGFVPGKKYPLVYLIHGGPQGAWLDQWHSRWNYAMFASRGYVVAAVNFHGSTGYGQAFTNSISRNWGGLPYVDLMRGLDRLARLPYVDSTRMAAAGASYGGYMIYWMAGQTNRFRALVAHDGIYNPLSMAGTTEELWFPRWEFGGNQLTAAGRAAIERWSPARYVEKWRTPMLVVHSQNDFRVDVSEGIQAFTALRLKGIPSKFLYFPDEDHFVARPRNRRLWWGTVLDWIDQYLQRS
ncbi:MAG: S9 family peptidase [Gemmatimonadales bacterium]